MTVTPGDGGTDPYDQGRDPYDDPAHRRPEDPDAAPTGRRPRPPRGRRDASPARAGADDPDGTGDGPGFGRGAGGPGQGGATRYGTGDPGGGQGTGDGPGFGRGGGDAGWRRGDGGQDTGDLGRRQDRPGGRAPAEGGYGRDGYEPYGRDQARDARYGDTWRRDTPDGGGWTPYADRRLGLPMPDAPAGPGYGRGYGDQDARYSTGDVRLPAPAPQAPPTPPRGGAWRGLALLMTGLAVALGLAVIFVVVNGTGQEAAAPGPARGAGLPEVTVPDLAGRDVADATNALQSIGLEIVVASPVPDPEVPADTVIDSNPPADALAAPGTLVRVTVSGGAPAEPVPGVGGLERGEAERILREAGFVLSAPVEEESADVAEGLVIRSDPEEGEEAQPDTEVQLVVSTGPPPFTLARLIGLTEADAVRQLQEAGLEPDVLRRFSTATAGQVVDQSPDGGVEVRPGDTVTITISLGQ